MTTQADIDKALVIAEKMLAAVLKKIPKHVGTVRRYESNENGYIEIVISPEHLNSRANELATAYADEFFVSATKENISEKATRIFKDFKILLGAK